MVSPLKKQKENKTNAQKDFRTNKKGCQVKTSYRPLAKKKFYLDLKGYRNVDSISQDIEDLGGEVEDFFSKEVSYVVSNRCTPKSLHSSSEINTQNPSPTTSVIPSPLTPQALSSFGSPSGNSPFVLDSPKQEAQRRGGVKRTRAELLLEKACAKKSGTCDILESARTLNIPIWSANKFLQWLNTLKGSEQYQQRKLLTSTPKVQKLKVPFIKLESFSRQFRPIFKELIEWPDLHLDCPVGVSPFASPSTWQEKIK